MTTVPTENAEQTALFEWAAYAEGKHPELALLHAIPNGSKRDIVTATILKRTGVKSGVPDICLPVARGGHHGLYIELKRLTGGTVSINQKTWVNALTEQGYHAVVCKGWVAAREVIEQYLK